MIIKFLSEKKNDSTQQLENKEHHILSLSHILYGVSERAQSTGKKIFGRWNIGHSKYAATKIDDDDEEEEVEEHLSQTYETNKQTNNAHWIGIEFWKRKTMLLSISQLIQSLTHSHSNVETLMFKAQMRLYSSKQATLKKSSLCVQNSTTAAPVPAATTMIIIIMGIV